LPSKPCDCVNGEAIDQFEIERKNSTFKALTQADTLKLQMIRRSYERYWQDVNNLLLVAAPQLLDDFKRAKAEQEQRRQEHLAMLARKRKIRERRIQQAIVAATTLIVGDAIAAAILHVIIRL
jgi:hypothetical protein